MIGCLLLGAGVFMAAKMAFRHHHGWHYGRWGHCGGGWQGGGGGGWYGHGYGPDGPDGGDFGPGYGPGHGGPFDGGPHWLHGRFGGGFFLRALAERLDATPAQEKVIRDATEEFRETASKLRGEGRKTRADLASAFRKGSFDEVLLGELFARHDRGIEEVRKAFVGMGARIHDVLDDRQREQVAEMIESGPGAWRPRWGRPGRGWGGARA
jgi:Spy/CpxP family protein refolding chaperone